MKFRISLSIALLALALNACSFSLAEDVTPPPDYVPPTVVPTHGPVFPTQAPDIQNGAGIFAQECAPCHGDLGLGDGAMGAQLSGKGITVPAIGSPESANAATPSDWFLTVTAGNMDRMMPPFADKLSDQERWNVVYYALSLGGTPEQISQGKNLFTTNCADCPTSLFTDQERMATLANNALLTIIRDGGEGLPAFGASFSQDELLATASYLRSLGFAASSPTPEPANVTATEAPAQTETPPVEPSAEGTPAESGAQTEVPTEAPAATGLGNVSGTVVSSGGDVPSGLPVILHGFDHAQGATTDPQEVLTLTSEVQADGSYSFENVEMPEGRIFIAEVSFNGVSLQSDLVNIAADMTSAELPPITLYETTSDASVLQMTQLHIFFDAATEGTLQVIEVYTFNNTSDQTLVVPTDGSDIPFIKAPDGAQNVGFDISQDSAPLMPADVGFAAPPSDTPYGMILFFTLPYTGKVNINQPVILPVPSVLMLVPEGIQLKSDQLTNAGMQTFQGSNFEQFNGSGLQSDSTLDFSLSGTPSGTTTAATINNHRSLLIGIGAFGVVLILAGIWLFLRNRNTDTDNLDDEMDDEFETAEDVMDAILALDDLHRAKKIPDQAYRVRREELKNRLKELA